MFAIGTEKNVEIKTKSFGGKNIGAFKRDREICRKKSFGGKLSLYWK